MLTSGFDILSRPPISWLLFLIKNCVCQKIQYFPQDGMLRHRFGLLEGRKKLQKFMSPLPSLFRATLSFFLFDSLPLSWFFEACPLYAHLHSRGTRECNNEKFSMGKFNKRGSCKLQLPQVTFNFLSSLFRLHKGECVNFTLP